LDSLLIALLDDSDSMNDGEWLPEAAEWRKVNTTYGRPPGELGKAANYSKKTRATLEAFNHFLQVMKYRRDTCDFYMAQFAGRTSEQRGSQIRHTGPLIYRVTHNFVNLFESQPLTADTYNPHGQGTAVYDAIMQAIEHATDKIANLPVEERPTQVTMVIQTDGADNQSMLRPYKVVGMMNELRQRRWNFVFLGTGAQAACTGRDDLEFTPGVDLIMYEVDDASGQFEKAAESVLESLITGTIGGI